MDLFLGYSVLGNVGMFLVFVFMIMLRILGDMVLFFLNLFCVDVSDFFFGNGILFFLMKGSVIYFFINLGYMILYFYFFENVFYLVYNDFNMENMIVFCVFILYNSVLV